MDNLGNLQALDGKDHCNEVEKCWLDVCVMALSSRTQKLSKLADSQEADIRLDLEERAQILQIIAEL